MLGFFRNNISMTRCLQLRKQNLKNINYWMTVRTGSFFFLLTEETSKVLHPVQQFHHARPEYCYPSNSSYPAPIQIPYQNSDIQSVEIMPIYNPYLFTQPGLSFIQEPIRLTQSPQTSANLRFLTQIPCNLSTLAVIFPIYFKSETSQYARYFTYRIVLFTSSVQLNAN